MTRVTCGNSSTTGRSSSPHATSGAEPACQSSSQLVQDVTRSLPFLLLPCCVFSSRKRCGRPKPGASSRSFFPGRRIKKASGYEGYAFVDWNELPRVYPQENNRYETRDTLACVAAGLLVLCAHDLFDHPDRKKMLGGLDAGGGE